MILFPYKNTSNCLHVKYPLLGIYGKLKNKIQQIKMLLYCEDVSIRLIFSYFHSKK